MRNKSVGVGVANTNLIAEDVTKSIMIVMMMSEHMIMLIVGLLYCLGIIALVMIDDE